MTGTYLKIEDIPTKRLTVVHDGEELYQTCVSSPISDRDLRDLASAVFRAGFKAGELIREVRAKESADR